MIAFATDKPILLLEKAIGTLAGLSTPDPNEGLLG